MGDTSVQGLDVQSEDEVLGARELEVLEEVDGVCGDLDVSGEFLDWGEKTESRVGVMIKGLVGGGVRELAPGLGNVNVSAPYHNCASLIRGFDGAVRVGAEEAEGCTFHGGDVGVGERGGQVEAIDVAMAVGDEEVKEGKSCADSETSMTLAHK
eukprot:g28351.t1